MSNYNLHLIKARRSYSINEMASLLRIDRKTCHRWLGRGGLRVIERDVNPLLVMGADLASFIKDARVKRARKLDDNEYFCMKCHKPVEAKEGSETTIKTGKTIGRANLAQLKKIGLCETCGTKLNRFLRVSQKD